jgi:hypothetical protein
MLKKLTASLFLVIILLAVMVAPAIAADSDSAVVSGDVPPSNVIDVSAPGDIDFGTMTRGTIATAGSEIPGLVFADAASWVVRATDNNTGTDSGYMLEIETSVPLTNQLEISDNSQGPWYTVPNGTFFQYPDSPTELPFYCRQDVDAGDPTGTYSITIVFIGTISE